MKPSTSQEISNAVMYAHKVIESPSEGIGAGSAMENVNVARALLTLFTIMSESKQAAWRLCTKAGTPVPWAKITDIDPDLHETKARANADRMAPADAPHVWEPMFVMRALLPEEAPPPAAEVQH